MQSIEIPREILVTGATGGVGRAFLNRARKEHCNVVGIYNKNSAAAEQILGTWEGAPGNLVMRACDLTDQAQVDALIDSLGKAYCPDVLIHLAAPRPEIQPLFRTGWDTYQRHLEGTLGTFVRLVRPFIKPMAQRGNSRVIAVLSTVVSGTPPRGFASYTTAKYALAGYMKCLAAEYAGRGLSVNMVSPGPMETGMLADLPTLFTEQMKAAIPGEQWIDVGSVAEAVWWLAAEAGPEVTGCNIPVSSGMTF